MTVVPCAAGEQRERRLDRVDVADRLAALELLDVEVGDAEPARLPLVDELGHRPPRLLERRTGRPVGPVDLVEVDPLEAEAAQAVLALLADRRWTQVVLDHAFGTPEPAAPALREDEHVLASAVRLERAADDLLGVAEPVDSRRVDPVDAALDRVADRGHRLVVVDRVPSRTSTGRRSPTRRSPTVVSSGPELAEHAHLHARLRPSSSR